MRIALAPAASPRLRRLMSSATKNAGGDSLQDSIRAAARGGSFQIGGSPRSTGEPAASGCRSTATFAEEYKIIVRFRPSSALYLPAVPSRRRVRRLLDIGVGGGA